MTEQQWLGHPDALKNVLVTPYAPLIGMKPIDDADEHSAGIYVYVCCGALVGTAHYNHCVTTPIWAALVAERGVKLDRVANTLAASRFIAHWAKQPVQEWECLRTEWVGATGQRYLTDTSRWTLASYQKPRSLRHQSVIEVLAGVLEDTSLVLTYVRPPYLFPTTDTQRAANAIHRAWHFLLKLGELVTDEQKALPAPPQPQDGSS